ncbi:MAG TPA: SRPBCC family protein [Pseudonocardiaceae bacterium]|nr:SRPBCC family protein [Pseudonocardiaceae bacterium]
MKLEHSFTVPAPVDTVWTALLDPQRVAPCFPGATISSASGDDFAGAVKVRLGPIALQYKGAGRFTETDETARRTVIEASGTASGGQSTAAATVTAVLAEQDEGTVVNVATELSITGTPAQFGRGLMEDVSKKIISQFAENLADTLGPQESPAKEGPIESAGSGEPAQAPSVRPGRQAPAGPARPAEDEIDLLDAAGGAVAKRVVPVVGVVAVLLLIIYWLRRR